MYVKIPHEDGLRAVTLVLVATPILVHRLHALVTSVSLTKSFLGIGYAELAYGASYGFASFGTNAGHNGTSGGAFFHQPEVYEDFVWRSVYTGAVVGKSIAEQFYGDVCGKSYYLGCSTGGRQGWKAVQKNPELFNGVVAGSPAMDTWAHVGFFGYALQTLGFNTSSVTLAQWAAVQQEVLNQCDGLDSAHDGILEDPSACVLDWASLVCSSTSNDTCLTPDQVEAAEKLFGLSPTTGPLYLSLIHI